MHSTTFSIFEIIVAMKSCVALSLGGEIRSLQFNFQKQGQLDLLSKPMFEGG